MPNLNITATTTPTTVKCEEDCTITFTVSPIGSEVYVDEVDIAVYLGDFATDMFFKNGNFSVDTPPDWTLTLTEDENETITTCKFTNKYGGEPFETTTFTIKGKVNDNYGTSTINLKAVLDTLEEEKNFSFTKSGGELFLRNFITTKATVTENDNYVPQTEFENGDSVRFIWESNGTAFSLYDGTGTDLLTDKTSKTYTLSNLLKDTTFILEASVIQATENAEETKIVLYDKITLKVSNPDISAKSLKIAEKVDFTDAIIINSLHTDGKFGNIFSYDDGTYNIRFNCDCVVAFALFNQFVEGKAIIDEYRVGKSRYLYSNPENRILDGCLLPFLKGNEIVLKVTGCLEGYIFTFGKCEKPWERLM